MRVPASSGAGRVPAFCLGFTFVLPLAPIQAIPDYPCGHDRNSLKMNVWASNPRQKEKIDMTTAKKASKKAAAKKPPVNAPLPEGMLGTSEVAAMCKIESRVLRAVLRAANKGSSGKRYAWKENDPFLKKLPDLIAEHQQREKSMLCP